MTPFSQLLKEYRAKTGRTMQTCARRAGISKSSWCLYENGKREPSYERAFHLLASLGYRHSQNLRKVD